MGGDANDYPGGMMDYGYSAVSQNPPRRGYSGYRRYRRSSNYNSGYRRRYSTFSRKAVVPSGSYVPKSTHIKLEYQGEWVSTGNTATTYTTLFRANSLFDPDYSFGGQQPMGFDEWSAFYSTYKVIASKITIEAVNNIGSTIPTCSMVVYPSNSATTGTSTRMEATPGAKIRIVGMGSGKHESVSLVHYATTDRVFAGAIRDTSTLCAATGADPSKVWWWILQFCSSQSGQNVQLRYKANIQYTVIFSDPKNLAMS